MIDIKTFITATEKASNRLARLLTAIGVVAGLIIIAFVAILLFSKLFIGRQRDKRQLRDLDKKFTYLKGLQSGQDAQNVRRLEIISRSNLLYGEIYEKFSSEFKRILEDYNKPAETSVAKLKQVIAKKDYGHFKGSYAEAKKLVFTFENQLLAFDKKLYETLKPEEDSRTSAVKVKEGYRDVKQKFSANEKELALVAETFEKIFAKIDANFDRYENLLECADYQEAESLMHMMERVVTDLGRAIIELPNLCSEAEKVLPEKMMLLGNDFIDVEKSGVPLFHLAFKKKVEVWNIELENVKEQLKELKLSGAQAKLDSVSKEIDELQKLLEQEVLDKKYFSENVKRAYDQVILLEKDFIKIVSKLPEVNQVYVVSEAQQNNLEVLKANINELGVTKRALDNFVHSATKQPYSILRSKLDQLVSDYEVAKQGVESFKAYIENIKGNSEDAYSLVFNYFYRLKKIESTIREMNMPEFTERYNEPIERCYYLLNEVDTLVKTQPIDVKRVNEKVEELKTISKALFDDVEKQYSDMKLAESSIVYNNQDRIHQSDVHEKLLFVEQDFYAGNFTRAYKNASELYQNRHIGNNK